MDQVTQTAQDVGLFENVNIKDRDTAAWEILIMLAGAYLLGLLTYWLIHRTMHREAAKPVAARTSRTRSAKKDDLTVIEGIGPKINDLLNDAGIMSYEDVVNAPLRKLKAVLEEAGPRFRMHDPSTWGEQARLAANGDFDELEKLQAKLNRGK